MLTNLIGWGAVAILTVSSAGSPFLGLALAAVLLLGQLLEARATARWRAERAAERSRLQRLYVR